jgi:hypothetical protein
MLAREKLISVTLLRSASSGEIKAPAGLEARRDNRAGARRYFYPALLCLRGLGKCRL